MEPINLCSSQLIRTVGQKNKSSRFKDHLSRLTAEIIKKSVRIACIRAIGDNGSRIYDRRGAFYGNVKLDNYIRRRQTIRAIDNTCGDLT